jgi:hypothetical protein
MPRPYVTLAEYPTDMVRLACTKCDRRGQYRKATLIERHGPDANMVDLRLTLAAVNCRWTSARLRAFSSFLQTREMPTRNLH